MPDPDPDPRLQSLRDRLLRPSPVRKVTVVGFDGADVLVRVARAEDRVVEGQACEGQGVEGQASEGCGVESARIPADEVSMRPVDHPSEILAVGQEIEAEEIGRRRGGRLELSVKACENPELRSFVLGMEPGRVVTGTVSQVADFGVFVHLDGEPDGLCTGFIRVVDLTWSHIDHACEAVEAGQRVTGQVVVSHTRQGQVVVSLKALQEDPVRPLR